MMLHDANQLSALTDEELLRIAYIEQDDLTSTALEKELRRRFEPVAKLSRLAIEQELTFSDLKEITDLPLCFNQMVLLLEALIGSDLTDVADLRAALDCIKAIKKAVKAAGNDPDTVTLDYPIIELLKEIDL